MNKPNEGPVIDAVRELLHRIWEVLKAIVEFTKSVPERIGERIDSLETKALIAFAVFLGVVFLHGILTRRK